MVLAAKPGQSATVLVALACTGGIPRNKSAGKAMKLPPPANALRVPAIPAAKNKMTAWLNGKVMKYQRAEWSRWRSQAVILLLFRSEMRGLDARAKRATILTP